MFLKVFKYKMEYICCIISIFADHVIEMYDSFAIICWENEYFFLKNADSESMNCITEQQ